MKSGLLVLVGAGILMISVRWHTQVETNETEAIVDTCSVAFGQGAYWEATGRGVYGPLECLVEPNRHGCISNYPPTGPKFLSPMLLSLAPRHGYKRTFTPGHPASKVQTTTGIAGFCYSAVPVTLGSTGRYSFGTDGSGLVCYDRTGVDLCRAGEPTGSAMPPDCVPFQCGDQGHRSPFGARGRKSDVMP